MTTHEDMLFHLGGLPVMMGIPFSRDSKYYFVDAANGSSGNSGLSPDKPLAKVSQAEDKCVANQHDCVILIGGSSTSAEIATITWDKNYTHLIGIGAPTRVSPRARIHNETTTGQTPLLNITSTGGIFKNFLIFQGVDEAVANINVQVTGGRNYFENVHFAGGGHASQAINGGASLKLDNAEENTFVKCTIGVDTIAAATGMMGMLVDGSANRNIFDGCHFTMYAGHTAAGFVEFVDTSAIDRYLWFKKCMFINMNDAQSMASVFVIPGAMTPPKGPVILEDCYWYGADDWDASDRGVIKQSMTTHTTGGNSGQLLASTAA